MKRVARKPLLYCTVCENMVSLLKQDITSEKITNRYQHNSPVY